MTKTISKNFDYSELPADTKGKLVKLATYFKKERESQVKSIIAAGRIIADAHAELAGSGREGKFAPWVESECKCSRSSAYNYMAAYQRFNKCPTVGHFDDAALYYLASDTVPEKAVKAAIKLSEKGEQITKAVAKELAEKHTVAPSANGQTDDPVTSTNGAAQAASSAPSQEPASDDSTGEQVSDELGPTEKCPDCGGTEFDEDKDGSFCVACKAPQECSHASRLRCHTCQQLYCEKCHPDHAADCEAVEEDHSEEEIAGAKKRLRNCLNQIRKRMGDMEPDLKILGTWGEAQRFYQEFRTVQSAVEA